MKKYIPIDFDEKGKVILGNAKNTPTSNGFIPTTWAPGGSDEEKQGLKSISISPAIQTTPALDTVHVYWEDLTDEEKQGLVRMVFQCPQQMFENRDYTVTLTPTQSWAVENDEDIPPAQPVSFTYTSLKQDGVVRVVTDEIALGNVENQEDWFLIQLVFVDDDPK